MKILVLGVSGMLGNAMFRVLAADPRHQVYATARSASVQRKFAPQLAEKVITGVDVENVDALVRLFEKVKPEIVINCIGLVKQLAEANEPMPALSINALLPHRIAHLCALAGARLVHISTDCVFSGREGSYLESDEPDAQDLYGRTKLLGEVDYPHAITLRTSIIGHEFDSTHGLIEWFLSQQGTVKGYTRAIFSGLPTCELAEVIRDYVIPEPGLRGVYQVASEPIAKYDLLHLVNQAYDKKLTITPDDQLRIDRSLNGNRFRSATGYIAPPWPQLIAKMHAFR